MHRDQDGTGEGGDRSRRVRRRAYLQAIAATGIAGIAGCTARNSPTPPASGSETDSPVPTGTSTLSATSSSTTTPGNPCAEPLPSPPESSDSPGDRGSIAWERTLSPVVAPVTPLDGSRLLVTTGDGMLVALSRETGDVVWDADLGGSVGAPLVEGNTIVVRRIEDDDVNYQDSQVTLHGLDAETGEERWTALTMTAGYAGGFYPITTTREFVLVREAIDVVPNVQPMHAVSLADGTTRWTAEVGTRRGTHVRNGTIYYAGHDAVTAFAFDGSRRWEWSHDISSYDALGGTSLVCDHVVVYGSEDDAIHGVGIESGESQWTFDPSNTYGRLYDHRGRLFVADEKQIRLNPTNGEPVWTRNEHRDHLSAGYGMVFGTKYDDPTITARAISDGTISWEQQVDGGTRLAGVANGQLFIIRPADDSLDGPSYVGALDAATGEQLWTLDAERGFDWHDAMIGAERAYVPDQSRPRTERDDAHGNGILRAIRL